MFNPIREQIAENKIDQALAACGDLDLAPADRSRLISLRRRWDLLTEQAIAQTREERLLRLEENGVVEDLLKWLDQMEYSPEAKDEWSVKVTHRKKGTGATAGTGGGSVKSSAKWLWVGASVIALLAITWIWRANVNPDRAPTAKVEQAREATETPARNEPATPPAREEPPAKTPTTPGKTTLKPGDLVATTPGKIDLSKVDLSKVEASKVQINPNIRLNSETLKKLTAANALMTTGEQVDIAVTVYNNEKFPTSYDASASKSLADYLDRKIGNMDVAYNVLTQKFHDHANRDRLFKHGAIEDKSLTAKRARFLLLVDLRKVSRTSDKAKMSLCLYDVGRNKSFPDNRQSRYQYSSEQQVKELYTYVDKYLEELKERGILK